MRTITASEEVITLIDQGAKVNDQLKTLTDEDKGIKSELVKKLASGIGKDEVSVRAEGKEAAAVISAAESMKVSAEAEYFDELKKVLAAGMLADIVTVSKSLVIPPAKVDDAAKVLLAAGIQASVIESFSVKPADVRKMRKSPPDNTAEADARRYLENCLSTDVTHKIKYEAK